jgi:NADPH-dependent 2,4-dienoyl-CoA reductase/sulfur reductase-like enzyme
MIEAQHLVLATGAYEYVPPFPGWTLPGVMSPGGAQSLVKTMNVLPGRKTLLAGTGPFLLVVANQLHEAGVEVVGIIESASGGEYIRELPSLMARPDLVWHGCRMLARLKRARIPIYRRHVIVQVSGDQEVREAVFAPCDEQWEPDRSRACVVAVDNVCVGYGFVPRTQLAQLAGCRMRFDDQLGGWIPHSDADLQTSVPGIWVAGDGAGVAGAIVAELEGTLAGLAVAHQLSALDRKAFEVRRRTIARRLSRMRRFRAALDRISRIRPGLSRLATADTVVCRCEERNRAEIDEAIDAGGTDIRTLKVMTRLGMGPCQGQMCWPAMARHIAIRTGKPMESIGPVSVRPPIKPVCVGTLAAATPAPAASTHQGHRPPSPDAAVVHRPLEAPE